MRRLAQRVAPRRWRLGLLLAILIAAGVYLQVLANNLHDKELAVEQATIALRRQALADVAAHHYRAAATAYAAAITADPASAAAIHFDLAQMYERAGQPDAAIAEYAAVLTGWGADPHHFRARACLQAGNIYQRKGDNAAAIDRYDQGLESEPDNAHLHEARSDAYRAQHEDQRAIADYRAALLLYGVPMQSGGVQYLTDALEERLNRKLHELGAW